MLTLLSLLLGCGESDKPGAANAKTEAPEAVADLFTALGTTSRVRVRGRALEELRDSELPMAQFSQEELKRADLEVALLGADGRDVVKTAARADDEGMFDVALDFTPVQPGAHTIVVRMGGHDIGQTTAQLLAPGHTDVVVRSDVDLTYLNTDFQSRTGMAKLVQQGADERSPLPGMPAVYRALQGDSADAWRPVTFLSGSPQFFKKVLEGRMRIDLLKPCFLVLKPMKDMATSGEIPLDKLVDALHEQIGYKLYWLLVLRTEIPAETPEILMGDDSEADFTVYDIYRRFTQGELELPALAAELEANQVTPSWQKKIADVAPTALAHLGDHKPVKAIYIHATDKPSANAPDALHPPEEMRVHDTAWALALDLAEGGWITAEDLPKIRAELLAGQVSEAAMEADAQTGRAAGWLDAGP